MSRVTTCLNFPGNTEEAFKFYKSIFGGEFTRGGISRLGDAPPSEGMPPIRPEEKNLVMHVELPILDGHLLMGSDVPVSMGFQLTIGNNVQIGIQPDTRAETRRLFDALSVGGKVTMALQDMFWGSYYGAFTDKFGIRWQVNCDQK
jgi:PhnB protein